MKIRLIIGIISLFFTFSLSGQWSQIGGEILGEYGGDLFGFQGSCAMNNDGSIVAIGSRFNDDGGENAGHVRVFQYDGTNWTQLGSDIDGEDLGDQSGMGVSLSGDGFVVAIGAIYADETTITGHVRIFEFDGVDWVQRGEDIDGLAYGDNFGSAVSLNDNGLRVAIGAPTADTPYSNSGQVKIFDWDGTNWILLGLPINGASLNGKLGYSVELDSSGLVVAIGSPRNNDIQDDAGLVRVYEYSTLVGQWMQIGDDLYGMAEDDLYGWDVSLSANGRILAISTPYTQYSGPYSGSIQVYQYVGDIWSGEWLQIGGDIIASEAYDRFGHSVDLSHDGKTLVTGIIGSVDVGATEVYKYHPSSGWVQVWGSVFGFAFNDEEGASVEISSDGMTFLTCTPYSDDLGTNTGRARIFSMAPCLVTSSIVTITACDSFTVFSGDEIYYTDGIYNDTIANVCGSDSIITINLTLNHSTTNTIYATGCNSYTVPSGDETYEFPGSFTVYDTLTNSMGCDSILTINVFLEKTETYLNVDSCYQYTVPSGDTIFFTSGTYIDTLTNSAGCDSILFLNISVNGDSPITYITVDTCNEYTLPSGDTTYYEYSGSPIVDTLSNIYGCDSIINIDLTVLPTAYSYLTIVTCDSFTVASGHETYYTSGLFLDTIPSFTGCDSIISYELTINNGTYNNIDVISCNSYEVPSGDATYTSSGIYFDTLTNVQGCDSILEISLTIAFDFESFDTVYACWGSEYVFSDGHSVLAEDTISYSSVLSTLYGCDSTINYQLISYNLDSTLEVTDDFLISNNPFSIETNYQWYMCEDGIATVPVGTDNQVYNPTENGWYAVSVTWNKVPCTVISECVWFGPDFTNISKTSSEFELYPNPTNGIIYLSALDINELQIILYDIQGKSYPSDLISQNSHGIFEIDMSLLESGIYLIQLEYEGKLEIMKIIKN